MKTTRHFRLQASQDKFDHQKQTRYCIDYSQKHIENQKKQSFLNKLSFDYSLQKINRQKFIGNLLTFSSRMYPAAKAEGNKYCNFEYSSDFFKETRKRFMSQRIEKQQVEELKQNSELKRYGHFSHKRRKSMHGGIDSFWLFKRNPTVEVKKKNRALSKQSIQQQMIHDNDQNKTEKAYIKLLSFAKLPLEIENSIVPKNVIKNYISGVFGEAFCTRFISFYQLKSYINFKQFELICEKFKNISARECHLVSFFLYDENGDGFLCPRDFFSKFDRQITPKIDKDIIKITKFIKNNVGRQNISNQEYKIESICIRDDWLTVKDYEMYFKRIDQPYLKATNKKDTVFSKSFAVIDHRQKIRSKRKQINEKKNLYEELYGQISKLKKIQAYIDSQAEYKLNYTLFHEIFGNSMPELYNYFINFMFGIGSKKGNEQK